MSAILVFKCPECESQVKMTTADFHDQMLDGGFPYCSDCDIEMEELEAENDL